MSHDARRTYFASPIGNHMNILCIRVHRKALFVAAACDNPCKGAPRLRWRTSTHTLEMYAEGRSSDLSGMRMSALPTTALLSYQPHKTRQQSPRGRVKRGARSLRVTSHQTDLASRTKIAAKQLGIIYSNCTDPTTPTQALTTSNNKIFKKSFIKDEIIQ